MHSGYPCHVHRWHSVPGHHGALQQWPRMENKPGNGPPSGEGPWPKSAPEVTSSADTAESFCRSGRA